MQTRKLAFSYQNKTKLYLSYSEIEKIQKGDSKKDDEENYLDLFSHKNMKLKERVLIPVKQYPKVRQKRPHFIIFVGVRVTGCNKDFWRL